MHRPLTPKIFVRNDDTKKSGTASVVKVTARQLHVEVASGRIVRFNRSTLKPVTGHDSHYRIVDMCGWAPA